MDVILNAFASVLDPSTLVAMVVGVLVGIVFGALPGLTFSMGIILVLPFTFWMDALTAIVLLLGVYIGGMTGGAVASILIGIPGTPSSAATCVDGYLLAKRGLAGKALGTALLASIFGGLTSMVVLMLVAPIVARMALGFGSGELFALVLFGFSTVCSISMGQVLRGLIAGFIGLLIMCIGMDPIMGMARYTFGVPRLQSGIDLLSFMIGMFAIPQVVQWFSIPEDSGRTDSSLKRHSGLATQYPSLAELRRLAPLVIRCTFIGIGIGAIPGTGGPIAAFLGLDQAKRRVKTDEPTLEGVAGPEAANNGVTGGALIPMLTLGIPGDPATAIMLGALLIHGLKPGPNLFVHSTDFVYGMYAALIIIHFLVLVIQGFGIQLFVRVLSIRRSILYTVILVLCVIGAYAVNNNVFDIYVMVFAGIVAFFMKKLNLPTAPTVLALVLGPAIEENFRRALIISQGDLRVFLSPISLFFFALTIVVIAGQVRRSAAKAGKSAA